MTDRVETAHAILVRDDDDLDDFVAYLVLEQDAGITLRRADGATQARFEYCGLAGASRESIAAAARDWARKALAADRGENRLPQGSQAAAD